VSEHTLWLLSLLTSVLCDLQFDSVVETELWTTKHRPQSVSHLVGNKEIVNKLTNWLKTWEEVHLKGGPLSLRSFLLFGFV
jgi:hypothetical protein